MRALTRAQPMVVLIGAILLGLTHASCAREAGIEIYEYQAGLLHAKTMIVDGIWATIGSTNLDPRSFTLNDELNAVVYHNQVVSQLEKIFADDLTYSRRLSLEQWRNRAGLNHLLELLSLPVRPRL